MRSGADVVVVGGGPAGSATAITSALRGLEVVLLEGRRFPRHRPGETLHPGAEPVLRQLGVEEQVAAATAVRHDGIAVEWGGNRTMTHYGDDEGGRWRGYQVSREVLDAILLARARRVGVEVLQPCVADDVVVDAGRVVGVRAGGETIRASVVVDAAGGAGWLRRRLGLRLRVASPPLRVYYGYTIGAPEAADPAPRMVGDARGWCWTAPIGTGTAQWTRLAFRPGRADAAEPPAWLAGEPSGRTRCADVTWRLASEAAGPGYFLVGEAAAVLDPAASHGVLRALLSGILAAHTGQAVVSAAIPEAAAVEGYRAWTTAWFEHDARRLAARYRELDPSWPGVAERASA